MTATENLPATFAAKYSRGSPDSANSTPGMDYADGDVAIVSVGASRMGKECQIRVLTESLAHRRLPILRFGERPTWPVLPVLRTVRD